jgi:hypothetical protein
MVLCKIGGLNVSNRYAGLPVSLLGKAPFCRHVEFCSYLKSIMTQVLQPLGECNYLKPLLRFAGRAGSMAGFAAPAGYPSSRIPAV